MTPLPILLLSAALAPQAGATSEAAPAADASELVELHLGASSPGVRLVCKPPLAPDADPATAPQPYVIEVRVLPWAEGAAGPAVSAVAMAAPTYASAAPGAGAAALTEMPVEAPPTGVQAAFLRHAPPPEEAVGAADPLQPLEDEQPGSALSEDEQAALDNYGKACDAGYGPSCMALGQLYQQGELVAQDDARAQEYLQRACDLGESQACEALAPPAATGSAGAPTGAAPLAVAVTPAAAPQQAPDPLEQLKQGCRENDPVACNGLGERYAHGQGVERDYGVAAKLFKQACSEGQMSGCTNLGILYRVGEGVSKDEQRARRLFMLSCNGGAGEQLACDLLEE